jgi:hypothetical protein
MEKKKKITILSLISVIIAFCPYGIIHNFINYEYKRFEVYTANIANSPYNKLCYRCNWGAATKSQEYSKYGTIIGTYYFCDKCTPPEKIKPGKHIVTAEIRWIGVIILGTV